MLDEDTVGLEILSPEIIELIVHHLESPTDLARLSSCSRLLLYACDTPFVWRQRLLADFADSDGIDGLDLAKKQEIELTLSTSRNTKQQATMCETELDVHGWKQKFARAARTRAFASPCWGPGLTTNIEARQCHAAARCGDFLVVFAGFTRDFDLYALDTRAQLLAPNPRQALQWARCKIRGQGPQVRMLYGHSMVALDTKTLIVYGGMSQPGYCFETNNTWLLRMESIDEWYWDQPTIPITGLLPPASGYHASCVCNGKMYVFGGISDGVLINNFSCLDLSTWVWTPCVPIESPAPKSTAQLPSNPESEPLNSSSVPLIPGLGPAPGKRQGSSMVSHRGRVYILGGTSGRHCQGGGQDFRDVFVWDSKKTCWIDHGIPRCPVSGIGRRHASVLVGDRILCFGGSAPSTNKACVLDLATKTWTLLETYGKVPTPRVSLTAHLCHNTIFVFGGSIHQGAMNSRTLYLLHPDKQFNENDFVPLEGENYRNEEEDYLGDDDEEDDYGYAREEGNRFPRIQCAQQ